MTARIIDGKAVSQERREALARRVEALVADGTRPGLAVVIVGDDPASQVYVRNKQQGCEQVGIYSEKHELAADASADELLSIIRWLNRRSDINGILVQLPLPGHLDAEEILRTIDPEKDVDGFHPFNVGEMVLGGPALLPCTPSGCIALLDGLDIDLTGTDAVVVGRSNIVGKPVAHMLLERNATVTICHSKTKDLADTVRRADIVVAAVGRPEMIKGEWIKPGAVVIDVGINRVESGLVGDVEFDSAAKVASAITPVPGGVGPMTIAMLLENTVVATERAVQST